MKFKTPWNIHEFPKVEGEKNFLPSMTVPDQTMSIREILIRHARGLPLDGTKTPVYHGEDDDMPDMRTLDLAERQELIENSKQEFEDLKEKLKKKPKPKPQNQQPQPQPLPLPDPPKPNDNPDPQQPK